MSSLPGLITISRTYSNHDNERPISITLLDAASHCELIEINLSLEEFASALFSYTQRPCEFEYRPNCPVGKTREVKTESVFIPCVSYENKTKKAKLVRAAIKQFEVDGWKGCDNDASHRITTYTRKEDGNKEGYFVTVGFTRFVAAASTPTEDGSEP